MKTVLVVDDEFGIVEVLVLTLEDDGYRVVSASNGCEGLERLAEVQPDLVLLDYMMPVMDGPTMAQAMRAGRRDTPIIMMSAVGEEPVRERFADYAVFVRKPFRVRAMLEAVRSVIGPPDQVAEG
jgi:CheY-like chemotaxis protein